MSVQTRQLNPDAARWRRELPSALEKRDAAPADTQALLNAAEALINSASCGTCVFFERGQCRAEPPRVAKIDGTAVWPAVSSGEWCGRWAATWSRT